MCNIFSHTLKEALLQSNMASCMIFGNHPVKKRNDLMCTIQALVSDYVIPMMFFFSIKYKEILRNGHCIPNQFSGCFYFVTLCVCNSNSVSSIKMTSPFFCSQRVPPVNRSLSSPTSSSIAQVDPPRDPSRIVGSAVDREQVYSWILELTNPETREHAFIELRYY